MTKSTAKKVQDGQHFEKGANGNLLLIHNAGNVGFTEYLVTRCITDEDCKAFKDDDEQKAAFCDGEYYVKISTGGRKPELMTIEKANQWLRDEYQKQQAEEPANA